MKLLFHLVCAAFSFCVLHSSFFALHARAELKAQSLLPSATGTADAGGGIIHMDGNQEGQGGFHGEGVVISSSHGFGSGSGTSHEHSMALYQTTITDTLGTNNCFVYLNCTAEFGSNSFYGDEVSVLSNKYGIFVFGSGSNSIILKNSNLVTEGNGPAFIWDATTSTTGDGVASVLVLENTSVTTSSTYSPVFQQIGDRASITVTGGTLATTGSCSPVIRLVAQNDNIGKTQNVVVLENTVLDAKKSSAIDFNIDAGAAELYGQGGGGEKDADAKVEDHYSILVQSSTVSGTVAALRIAAAGSGASTYFQNSNLFIFDSTFSGGIQMVAGRENFQYNFSSGGNLTLTASNSVFDGGLFITGTDAATRSNQAIFDVYDSTWTGDITLTNRGNLTLQSANTLIGGNLSLSGSTLAQLKLTSSPVTGDLSTADTAAITGYVAGAGQIGSVVAGGGLVELDLEHVPSGGITAKNTGNIALRIGNEVTVTGGIHLSGSSSVAITLRDAALLTTSDVTILDRATFAAGTVATGAVTLTGNVNLAGGWRIPGKTVLSGNLAITDFRGTLSIDNAGVDSLVLANGMSGRGRVEITSFDKSIMGDSEIRVIHDESGALAPDSFALARPINNGTVSYIIENRPDGAYLVGGLNAWILSVDKTILSLAQSAGSTNDFTVSANGVWTASSDANWLAVFPASGIEGNNTVTISAVSANTTGAPRTAGVVIAGGEITRSVIVTQHAIGSGTAAPAALTDGATLVFDFGGDPETERYSVAADKTLIPSGGSPAISYEYESTGNTGTLIFDDSVWMLDFSTNTFTLYAFDNNGPYELTGEFIYTTDIHYTLGIDIGFGPNILAFVPAGTRMPLTAKAASAGKVFDRWTSSNGGTFDNAFAMTTTFTMPTNDTTVTANYKDQPASSSGGGGGGAPSLFVLPALGLLCIFRWCRRVFN